ncbi:MAG TPA: NADPH-dependent glutamate synthase [bacterium]|nr:NADPH-dependent glutamate synthase [bacterium]HPV21973.1 NADPH-dependent glutamate synthase [bacterium]HRQ69989.1 NADPH-dependent glutamate synthase [bacterium]
MKKTDIPAQIMPLCDPEKRKKNMDEVPLGYTMEMAVTEASRCLDCKNAPCVKGCPVGIDIPKMLNLTAEKKFTEALETVREMNFLPAICGRVCPQENQCQKECTLGKMKGGTVPPLSIGNIERFLADNYSDEIIIEKTASPTGKKIAIAGSGPGGLTCAGELAAMGHKAVIFEALHKPGGVLIYGIPEFRLPRYILSREIEFLRRLGVELVMNTIVGKTITVDEILKEYDALYVTTGAGVPHFPDIPGTHLYGTSSANEFLTRVNLMESWKKDSRTPLFVGETTIVIGGGNVAMDAARTALRTGSKRVIVAYRREEHDMPARREEVIHAKEEGIEFMFLISPEKIVENEHGHTGGVLFRKMRSEINPEGGKNRIFDTDETFLIDCDAVIFATGTSPNPIVAKSLPSLATNKAGGIAVDMNNMKTSVPGVFAGGDAVSGAATVILTMLHGKTAAKAINEFLK